MSFARIFQRHRRCSSSLFCWLAALQVARVPSTAFSTSPNYKSGVHCLTPTIYQQQAGLEAAHSPNGFLAEFSSQSRTVMLSATTKKRESPSAERNKEPIWNIFQSKVLPQDQDSVQILEVAGGAGVHMHYLAVKLMQQSKTVSYHYQPTDPDPSSLESQQAYLDEILLASKNPNVVVASPLQLTLDEQGIQEEPTVAELSKRQPWDIIININMIHISPWSATLGLMKTAGMYLRPGGILYLYGPYRVNGTCVESNL